MKHLLLICFLFMNKQLCATVPKLNTVDSMSAHVKEVVYLVREAKAGTKPSLLLLLHGYASNETDLFTFNNRIPENWTVVAIRGFRAIRNDKYCWYDVENFGGKIIVNIPEEENSRKRLLILTDELIEKYNADTARVVIVGFSQGANMALACSLTDPNKYIGVGMFSGRMLEEIRPTSMNMYSVKRIKAFISHGNRDALLPVRYAIENTAELRKMGIDVKYVEDNSGHNITFRQFDEFLEWLSKI